MFGYFMKIIKRKKKKQNKGKKRNITIRQKGRKSLSLCQDVK